MKQFGNVVTVVRPDGKGGVQKINALVAQSAPGSDGEHLAVVYLDPAQSSPFLAGAAIDKAITKAFVTPIGVEAPEGHGAKQYGWEELEGGANDESLTAQVAQLTENSAKLLDELNTQLQNVQQANLDLKDKTEEARILGEENSSLRDRVGDLEAQLLQANAKKAEPSASDPTSSAHTGPSTETPALNSGDQTEPSAPPSQDPQS